MSTSAMRILCRYQYDPLDRLTGLKSAEHVDTQRFYQNDELVNEIADQVELTILRHAAQPLAQRLHSANVTETTLLAMDQQRSVLHTLAGANAQRMAYTAYGHRSAESGLSSLLGFNGERPDAVTGHYLLGQGNRAFNPVLMRFNSPDELSPFGDGGINAYGYCGGDPINRYDPSGNVAFHLILRTRIAKIGYSLVRPPMPLTTLHPSSRAISRTARPRSPWRPWEGAAPKAGKNPMSRELPQKPSGVSSSAAPTVAPSESINITKNKVYILPPEPHEGFRPSQRLTDKPHWLDTKRVIAEQYDQLAADNKINIRPDENYIKGYLSAVTNVEKRNARLFAKENVMSKLAEQRNMIRS